MPNPSRLAFVPLVFVVGCAPIGADMRAAELPGLKAHDSPDTNFYRDASSCDGGDGPACYRVGTGYEAGVTNVAPKSPPLALDRFQRACKLGVREGCDRAAVLGGATGPTAAASPAGPSNAPPLPVLTASPPEAAPAEATP